MATADCVTEQDLRAFLLGELPERIGQSVAAHLEGCPHCEALARQLDALPDSVIHSLRQVLRPGETPKPAAWETPDPRQTALPTTWPQRVGSYTILDEVGRGGMEVVYKARQDRPVRIVALKMLLGGSHSSAERRARFRAEADAIAQLRHPNIVQVFEAGEHDDLPFLTLEFCDGGSLAKQLGGMPQLPASAAQRMELLARAVHHAHQAGIVHRDLKPANVLLTAEGQLKVSDFGLAKAERPEITATGAVLGTPSYMAPEQAEGRREVGPATDVYALGAMLYELLTGRPPFLAESALDTVYQVVNEEPLPPRRLNAKIPPDLETICLKCLHKAPGRRYISAGELADDLGRWQRGEPIRARPAGRFERAGKWTRRRPAAAALLGVSVLAVLGLAALAGVAVWQWQTAVTALASERTALASERTALHQAEANLGLARQAVDRTFNVARDDPLFQQPRMERARSLLLRKTLPFYKNFRSQRPHDRGLQHDEAEQWFRVGYIEQALLETGEALTAFEKARDLYAGLVQAYPEVAENQQSLAVTHDNLGVLLRGLGKREEALKEHQQARDLLNELVKAHPQVSEYQNDLARTHTYLGGLLADLGRQEEALKEYQRARDIQDKLVKASPEYQHVQARTHSNLGLLLKGLGKREQALRAYQKARDLLGKLVTAHPQVPGYQHDLAQTHTNLGMLLAALGRREEAMKEHQQARDIQRKLVNAHPDLPAYQNLLAAAHNNLGITLQSLVRREEALKEFQQARDIQAKLVKVHREMPLYQHDLAGTYHNLGMLLQDLGRGEEALKEYQQAHDLRSKLDKAYPGLPKYMEGSAATHHSRGVVLDGLGKHQEALKEYQQARDIQGKLVKAHPKVPEYQNDLGLALFNLGNLLPNLGRGEEAVTKYQQALEVQGKLVKSFPTVAEYQAALASTHNNLGYLLEGLGKQTQALKEHQQAVEIRSKLVEAHPDVLEYRVRLGGAHCNMGNLFRRLGKPQEGLVHYSRAIDLLQTVRQREPKNATARLFLRNSHWGRAQALSLLGRHHEEDIDWDQAIEQDPGPSRGFLRLQRALSRARAGDYLRAVAEADLMGRSESLPGEILSLLASIQALSSASGGREASRPLPDREKRSEQYARQAVALLRRAAATGFFRNQTNLIQLDKDADLTVLRDRDDYRRFRAGLTPPK
jgi:tetratricopeptide (TPR) repeat protein/tRNA A-37 threonylcarbamoyl transferase component Bud32